MHFSQKIACTSSQDYIFWLFFPHLFPLLQADPQMYGLFKKMQTVMVVEKCITASGEEAVLFELTERFKYQHIGYQVNICLFQYDMLYSDSSTGAINRRFSLKVVCFVFLNVLLLLSRLKIFLSFPFSFCVLLFQSRLYYLNKMCIAGDNMHFQKLLLSF